MASPIDLIITPLVMFPNDHSMTFEVEGTLYFVGRENTMYSAMENFSFIPLAFVLVVQKRSIKHYNELYYLCHYDC